MISAAGQSGNIPVRLPARCRTQPSPTSVLRTEYTAVRARDRCSCRELLLLIALQLLAGSAAAAEVYKWKDAEGHLHFGDRPPGAATNAESVTIRSGAPAAANGNSQDRLRQVLDGFTKEREAREASQAAAQHAQEQREQACTRAKARQYSAEHSNFLFVYTPTGERRVLEGAEYNSVIDKARQAVADSCD